MSHLRFCTLSIQDASEDILREAIQHIVRLSSGLQSVTSIEDYSGNPVRVIAGIRGAGTARGYGINIKNGQFERVGDDFGQTMKLEEFDKMVQNAYKATVYSRALSRNGFRPQIIQQNRQLLVVGQA